jgi:hypothetical protein
VGWWVDCGSPHGATTPIRATKPTEHRIDISGPDLFVTRRLGNGRNQGHLLICISPQFSFPRTTITGEHVREPGPDHRTTPRIYICTDGRSDHTPHTHTHARGSVRQSPVAADAAAAFLRSCTYVSVSPLRCGMLRGFWHLVLRARHGRDGLRISRRQRASGLNYLLRSSERIISPHRRPKGRCRPCACCSPTVRGRKDG